ncbi:hypothetical protein ACUHMQ_13955 [Chitinimonas sp. PSY-7]|uniref:hypothetical protein n=1 Tax=Chitinimonas sp. PSY-7 TaxID=3459088 RepID=UPI00403FFFA7
MHIRHYALLGCLIGAVQAADIAIIVHPQAGVDKLSRDEIVQLFLGKSSSFPNGKLVTPVELRDGPLREEFSTRILNKSVTAVRANRARMQFTGKAIAPKELANSTEVKGFVATNPNSIGYIEKSEVDSSVRVVASY